MGLGIVGGFNTYGCVYGNPTGLIDPDGRLTLLLPALGIPLVVGAIMASTPSGKQSLIDGINMAIEFCKPNDDDPCEKLRKEIRDSQAQLA
jgi:hypothetical protein